LRHQCRFARTYVFESAEKCRTDCIVIANHGCWTFDRANDPEQLPTIEQLPMGEVNVGDGDVAQAENLGETGRKAARHS